MTVAHLTTAQQPTPDLEHARAFLAALGRDPSTVHLRAFLHSRSPKERKEELKGRLFRFDAAQIERAQSEGFGVYVVINPGGQRKVEISQCIAYFAEFDSGTKEEQWQQIVNSNLPEPTLVVDSGGKSLHVYWLLTTPATDKQTWQEDMRRLAHHLGSDKSINDPSRVMRLPGCWYMDAQQRPTRQSKVIYESSSRVDRASFMALVPALPEPTPPPPGPPVQRTTPTSRLQETALRALERVPSRVPGSNTREAYLRLLWSLSTVLQSPQQAAAALIHHSPAWAQAEDLQKLAAQGQGKLQAGTFFRTIRQEFGVRANDRVRQQTPLSPPRQQQPVGPESLDFHEVPHNTAESFDLDAQAIGHLKIVLQRELSNGLSGADLEARYIELATEYGCSTYDLRQLAKSLELSDVVDSQVEGELAAIRTASQQRKMRKLFTLETILPPECVEPLRYLSYTLQADDLVTAMTFLTACSGVIKAGTRVWGDGSLFAERPQMWLALIAKSGMGKTQVIKNLGFNLVNKVEDHYIALNNERNLTWQQSINAMPAAERRRFPAPEPYIAKLTDYTWSAMAKVLANNEEQRLPVLVAVDELAGLFQGLDQFKAGKGNERAKLLEMYDNNGYSQARVRDGVTSYREAQVAVMGGIQPEVFNQLCKGVDPDGLFARLHLIPLATELAPRRPREEDDPNIARRHIDTLQDIVLRVFGLEPMQLRLAPECDVHMERLVKRTWQLKENSTQQAHCAIYGKREGSVLRLAAVAHMINIATGHVDPENKTLIPLRTFEAAIAYVEHNQGYAINAQDEARIANEGGIDNLTRRIIEFAVKQEAKGDPEKHPITVSRFVSNCLTPNQREQNKKDDRVKQTVHKMVAQGIAQWADAGSRNGGRRFRIVNNPLDQKD